jgi:hypothetical protein
MTTSSGQKSKASPRSSRTQRMSRYRVTTFLDSIIPFRAERTQPPQLPTSSKPSPISPKRKRRYAVTDPDGPPIQEAEVEPPAPITTGNDAQSPGEMNQGIPNTPKRQKTQVSASSNCVHHCIFTSLKHARYLEDLEANFPRFLDGILAQEAPLNPNKPCDCIASRLPRTARGCS